MRHAGNVPSVLAVAAILAILPGCRRAESAKVDAAKNAPPEVRVAQPVEGEVTDYEDFTGRADAMKSVEVRARVTGYLDAVHFEDGSEVKEGELLFEIDPRPYQAELDRTEATYAQAEARMRNAETEYQRTSALLKRGSVTREEFQMTTDALAEARAGVGIQRAARDLAKLNLEFTKVRAPISGRISRRMVDPGNLVQADTTMLTTIVSLDPVYVYFDIDERTVLRLRRLVGEGKIASRREAKLPFRVALADEEGFPREGTIDFSDNRIDPSTGTLQARGVIENPKPHVLSPGLFLRVRLPIGVPYRAVMIAEQALGSDQGRKYLYVVNDRNEAEFRPVEVGPLREGLRVIEKGLKPGERVVVSGLQRLRPGAKVVPKPAEGVAGRPAPASPGEDATAEAKAAPAPRGT
jgi:RND family efflux transporter MFP subunit